MSAQESTPGDADSTGDPRDITPDPLPPSSCDDDAGLHARIYEALPRVLSREAVGRRAFIVEDVDGDAPRNARVVAHGPQSNAPHLARNDAS